MGKKIFLDPSKKHELAASLGCTEMSVRNALNFVRNTELARKIRFVALKQYGGVPSWRVDMDTVHTSREMIQSFGDDVRLILEKRSGRVRLEESGKVLSESSSPSIEEYVRLQEVARRRAILL